MAKKYNEVISFNETTQCNPSKNNPEERGLYLSWIKLNIKLMNAGQMKEESVASFLKLLELREKYKHENQ